MLVVRPRSATDLLVFRGRADLGVLAIVGLLDMENACGQCIIGTILVPTGTGRGALPGEVAELFVEVAKCESHHLGRGTGSALTSSVSTASAASSWWGRGSGNRRNRSCSCSCPGGGRRCCPGPIWRFHNGLEFGREAACDHSHHRGRERT